MSLITNSVTAENIVSEKDLELSSKYKISFDTNNLLLQNNHINNYISTTVFSVTESVYQHELMLL